MVPDGREGGKDLGEIEGGEAIIRIYCMKKFYFQLKKNKREIGTISCTPEAGGSEFHLSELHISSRPAVDAAKESKEVGILQTDC